MSLFNNNCETNTKLSIMLHQDKHNHEDPKLNLEHSSKMPFEIEEENYFDENIKKLESEIRLKNISANTQPQEVPTTYFDSLSDRILNKVKTEEMAEPELSLSKENPYQVPANYFEEFSRKMLEKVNTPTEESTNTVAFPARKTSKPWMWVAAAMALFMGIFGIMKLVDQEQQQVAKELSIEEKIKELSLFDIEEYLSLTTEGEEMNTDDIEMDADFMERLNNLALSDIEFYLED